MFNDNPLQTDTFLLTLTTIHSAYSDPLILVQYRIEISLYLLTYLITRQLTSSP